MILKKIYRYSQTKKLQNIAKRKKLKAIWLPKIQNHHTLSREIARAVWYTNPFIDQVDRITFFVSSDLLRNFKNFVTPAYADKSIYQLYEKIKNKIVFIDKVNKQKLSNSDIAVYWKRTKQYSKWDKSLFRVDGAIEENQFEANQMVKLSYSFLSTSDKKHNNLSLQKYLLSISGKKVNIFGSGPSLHQYKKYNFNNSVNIICNSIVKNKQLLEDIKPDIVVATDAVFHSGYSSYASDFRNALCIAMDTYTHLHFLVPMRDLLLYRAVLPIKFHTRILGVESKNLKRFNINLLNKTYVKSTSNVLTAYLLPIASTLSKEINLLGFDGKEVVDKDKFWNYDMQSQFIDSISDTKLAHPAFYQVDYDKYYERHCMETEELIKYMISKKIKTRVLEPSKIPILAECYA